ncbi:hypothetical protein K3495_g6352 [Podosphaera aphanis]|nr:hypothetical protein K3495_g6352 [Podosphaera aphanis]
MSNNSLSEGIDVIRHYHCRQEYSVSNSSNPPSQIRDGHRYDPVRESREWDQDNTNPPNIPSNNNLQSSFPSWTTQPYLAVQAQSYPVYPEVLHNSNESQDFSSTRPPPTFLNMPWNNRYGFDIYSNHNQLNHGSSELTASSSSHQLLATTTEHTIVTSNHLEAVSSPSLPPMAQVQELAQQLDQSSRSFVHDYQPPLFRETAFTEWEQSESDYSETRVNTPDTQRNFSLSQHENQDLYDDSDDSDEEGDEPDLAANLTIQRQEGERSLAAFRGALAACKRIPSRKTLESLEPVKIKELGDSELMCIICYNPFGVTNPEGIIEFPLRLPKCKHIFGDKCIKRWFEDSDSCPYCRDKLPCELLVGKSLGQTSTRVERDPITSWSLRARISNARRRNFSPDHLGFRRSDLTQPVSQEREQPISREISIDSVERRRRIRNTIAITRSVQSYRQNAGVMALENNRLHLEINTGVSAPSEGTISSPPSGISVNTAVTGEVIVPTSRIPMLPPPYQFSARPMPSSGTINSSTFRCNAEAALAHIEHLNQLGHQMQRTLAEAHSYLPFPDLSSSQILLSMQQPQSYLSSTGPQLYSNISRGFSATNPSLQQTEGIRESDIGHRQETDFYAGGSLSTEILTRWSS